MKKKVAIAGLALASILVTGSSLALISEDEAVDLALEDLTAEVDSVHLMNWNGRNIWNVRLIDEDGFALVRYFDAETGEELDIELDTETTNDQ